MQAEGDGEALETLQSIEIDTRLEEVRAALEARTVPGGQKQLGEPLCSKGRASLGYEVAEGCVHLDSIVWAGGAPELPELD